jgi:ATP-dependent protease ClpP protease subunit
MPLDGHPPGQAASPQMSTPSWIFGMSGASSDTLELDIYDDIGESYWGDTVSAKDVRAALKASPNATTIKLRINSRGGDVFDGFAIYNLLSEHKARVVAHVDALAASMASVVLMAADEIVLASNALVMIHNPWTVAYGESDDLRQTADLLDKMRERIADTYVARTGIARDRVIAMMNAETWLTADEAKAEGFADGVVPSKRGAEQAKALASLRFDGLVSPPKTLIAACARARAEIADSTKGAEPMQEKAMDKEQRIALCSALGLSADVSNDVLVQRASALKSAEGKAPEGFELTPKGEFAAAQARALAAETELLATRKASRDVAVNALIDEAVKSGKATPASREKYAALCATDAGFEAVKDLFAALAPMALVGEQGRDGAPKGAADICALTDEERAVAKALGKSEAEMLAYKKAEATNGGAV